jgi:DNA-binding transcriptional MerR regulator
MLKEPRTLLTISEAANELGVTSAWLRLAERLGAVPLARRAPNGWRVYSDADVERLRRLGVGQRKKRRLAER